MKLPTEVVVLGKRYAVEYPEHMTQVDVDKRSALWGQIDYHTRTIRIWQGSEDHKRQPIDMLHTLIHEVAHAIICDSGFLSHCIKDKDCEEVVVDQLAVGMADTLIRNGWIQFDEKPVPPAKAKK